VNASAKVWLKLYEFSKYGQLVIWACGADSYKDSVTLLIQRIKSMCKKSGFQATFYYLKEVLKIVVGFLATGVAKTNRGTVKGSPMVQTDSRGLPTIIPWKLRELLLFYQEGNRGVQSIIVCILTVLSIFRVFPTKVRPKLGTILAPFSGSTRTFDSSQLKRALESLFAIAGTPLGEFANWMKSPQLLILEKASPNARKSTWSAGLDAAAFIYYPKVLYYYVYYNVVVHPKGLWMTAWILSILLVSLPLIALIAIMGGTVRLFMGKLAVVFDQAGKARVVAISNFWVQCMLRPLHLAIFSLLKRIPMDGTHDQEAPLRLLIAEAPAGTKFYSFDLSAATDRLPIDIQRDILNILSPGLGNA
jgi:hypothetical protein